ncbi:MAG: CoA transferase [Dehalococcoidia bacterium]
MTNSDGTDGPLLDSIRVLELGPALAGAVCGRMFADLGADVIRVTGAAADAGDVGDAMLAAVNASKRTVVLDTASDAGGAELVRLAADADLIVAAGPPSVLEASAIAPERLRDAAPDAVIAAITPFGLTGPYRDLAGEAGGGDLVAFHASGIARLLIGQVDDPEAEPPVRAAGEQSEFIAGVAAACATMHALLGRQGSGEGALIDVSVQEALACMAVRDLAQPAYDQPSAGRRWLVLGGGAVVTILPTSDGEIAISPREDRQWAAWLGVMGDPAWGADARFADRPSRVEHWSELHELMAAWSAQRTKAEIFAAGQGAHVPCFPLSTPAELLASEQLEHRRYFRPLELADGASVRVPRLPFGLPDTAHGPAAPSSAQDDKASVEWRERRAATSRRGDGGSLPLAGVRVLDFSWVIAGPTCTRYLAALGAEVLKVETEGRPDPGRASELHAVLGQSKQGIALNLRSPEAVEVAKRLVAESDVVVENFATGVMDRLGLGEDVLFELRPDLVLLSASGMGRTGPEAGHVAYGTLLQCYTGFAGMNGYPGRPSAVGMAWLDPMCGLMMAFAVAAALHDRRATQHATRSRRRIDFSMVEALLWTMPGPLIEYQLTGRLPERAGNDHPTHAPHAVYRCTGDDAWLAIAVTSDEQWRALCAAVDGLGSFAELGEDERRARRGEIDDAIASWAAGRDRHEGWAVLRAAGVPSAPSLSGRDLFDDPHLRERGFYRPVSDLDGVERLLPGLPWREAAVDASTPRTAPALGGDTDDILRRVLGMGDAEIAELRAAGALS